MANICLITTSQPSTNPRLVKEANALSSIGHQVTVLYCYRAKWAVKADQFLFKRIKWQYQLVGGATRHHKWRYLWTRARRKLSETLPFLPLALERSCCQAYDELVKSAKRTKADLFIAHNPGALPVAYVVSKSLRKPFGFDAEDFHSAENINGHTQNLSHQRLEQKYLPGASYLTAASPLILENYINTYSFLGNTPKVTVNNVFPLISQPTFQPQEIQIDKLKIVWFSQTLGKDRGIEDFLSSLPLIKEIPLEITLIGNSTETIKDYFKSFVNNSKHKLKFINPLPQEQLISLIANFHIGLALERRIPFNRDICLTNKIFTYLLCGNAIIASQTKAQIHFLENYPGVGMSYPIGDQQKLATVIRTYWENPFLLKEHREEAWRLANTELNWENEQKKFLKIIGKVLEKRLKV